METEDLTDHQINTIQNATESLYSVYRNNHTLPLAYAYDSYIKATTWSALNAIEKQEALLQGVVLDNYTGNLSETKLHLTSSILDYVLKCNGPGITQEGNTFVVTKPNSTVTFDFEGLPDSETYFLIKNLSYKGFPEYDLYFGDETSDPLNLYNGTNWDILSFKYKEAIKKNKLFWYNPTDTNLEVKSSAGVSKSLTYFTEDASYYNDRHNFAINLGYKSKAETSLTVTFSKRGIYSFDSLNIICQPLGKDYEQNILSLKKDTLQNLTVKNNIVSGTISLDQERILCFAIPYSAGWKAYVDGKETKLYQANTMYMAIDLSAGNHSILLTYQTPLLNVGFIVTAISFIVFILYIIYNERKKRY